MSGDGEGQIRNFVHCVRMCLNSEEAQLAKCYFHFMKNKGILLILLEAHKLPLNSGTAPMNPPDASNTKKAVSIGPLAK